MVAKTATQKLLGSSELTVRQWSWLDWVGLLAAVTTLWVAQGRTGLAIGATIVSFRALFSPLVAYAVGHVLLLASPWTLQMAAIVESSLLVVLVAPIASHPAPAALLVAALTSALVAVGVASLVFVTSPPLWVMTAAFLAGITAVGYTIHRLEYTSLSPSNATS